MKIPVMVVDSAASMSEVEINGDSYKLPKYNEEYKYLSAFPITHDGSFIAMCSKDLNAWTICIGAVLNGEVIDIKEFQEKVKEACTEEQNDEE